MKRWNYSRHDCYLGMVTTTTTATAESCRPWDANELNCELELFLLFLSLNPHLRLRWHPHQPLLGPLGLRRWIIEVASLHAQVFELGIVTIFDILGHFFSFFAFSHFTHFVCNLLLISLVLIIIVCRLKSTSPNAEMEKKNFYFWLALFLCVCNFFFHSSLLVPMR